MTPRQASLLQLLADYPGELDAEALADLAVPRPRLTSAGAYLAWRSTYAANRRAARADVTRDLAALVSAGLVERCRPPELAEWARRDIERAAEAYRAEWRTLSRFIGRRSKPSKAEAWTLGVQSVVGSAGMHEADTFPCCVAIIRRLWKGPTMTKRILGRSPSGATKRAWAMLCDSGIVVPSSRRVLTPAGLDAVGRMRGWA